MPQRDSKGRFTSGGGSSGGGSSGGSGGGSGVKLFGDWDKADKIVNTMQPTFDQAARKAMLQFAHFLRRQIVTGIREGAPGGEAFTPLSPKTLAVRAFRGFKGTKPLIHRGDLRNAIVVKEVPSMKAVFVGVLRSASRGGQPGGEPLINVAQLMEQGGGPYVVPITAKSRRFYHAALEAAGLAPAGGGGGASGSGSGKVSIAIFRIPARPFLRPVFDKYAKPDDVRAFFYDAVAKMMNGMLGAP